MSAVRVDAELVRRGLVPSRSRAASLIDSGRVTVDGVVVAKPSVKVTATSDLVVDVEAGQDYASRAAYKLLGALESFAAAGATTLDEAITGAWALDVGASTGGFTDVLLRRGADHVVALDVGHGQLVDELRADDRVTVIEGFNARELAPGALARTPDVVVADISFISLRMIVGPVVSVAAPGTTYLLMVKPQFEVGRERLGSNGVVRSEALREQSVAGVVEEAEQHGLWLRGVVPSVLPGPHGNREFFVWLERRPEGAGHTDWPAAVRRAVRSPEGPEARAELVSPEGTPTSTGDEA